MFTCFFCYSVHNKNSRRSFPLSVHGYDKFKKVCNIMQENGIKFTLPSSSSIDTNPSENSAGQQSKGSLELGVAEAGNTTNLPLNLRRSKSLPGRRDTQGGTSIWKVNDTINSNIISIATNTVFYVIVKFFFWFWITFSQLLNKKLFVLS